MDCGTVAASEKFQLDVIDPAAPSAGPPIDGRPSQSLQQRLGQADAFVTVTPEYNHGYPAPLKALIDSSGANGTPNRLRLSLMAGSPVDLRAVEQLRLVFTELHAVTIRDSVSFPGAWEQFDDRVRYAIQNALREAWRHFSRD